MFTPLLKTKKLHNSNYGLVQHSIIHYNYQCQWLDRVKILREIVCSMTLLKFRLLENLKGILFVLCCEKEPCLVILYWFLIFLYKFYLPKHEMLSRHLFPLIAAIEALNLTGWKASKYVKKVGVLRANYLFINLYLYQGSLIPIQSNC